MNIEKLPKLTCHFCLHTKYNDKLYKISPKKNLNILYCHKNCLNKYKEVFNIFLDSNNINLDLDKLISKKMIISNTLFTINNESEIEFNKGLNNLETFSKKYKIEDTLFKYYLEFIICISYWDIFN